MKTFLIISTLILTSFCLGQKIDSVKIYSFYLGSQFRYGQSFQDLVNQGTETKIQSSENLVTFERKYTVLKSLFNMKSKRSDGIGDKRLVCFVYSGTDVDSIAFTERACDLIEINGIEKNLGNSDFLLYLVSEISQEEQRNQNIRFVLNHRKELKGDQNIEYSIISDKGDFVSDTILPNSICIDTLSAIVFYSTEHIKETQSLIRSFSYAQDVMKTYGVQYGFLKINKTPDKTQKVKLEYYYIKSCNMSCIQELIREDFHFLNLNRK